MKQQNAATLDTLMKEGKRLSHSREWQKENNLPRVSYLGVDLNEPGGVRTKTEYALVIAVDLGGHWPATIKMYFSAEPTPVQIEERIIQNVGNLR